MGSAWINAPPPTNTPRNTNKRIEPYRIPDPPNKSHLAKKPLQMPAEMDIAEYSPVSPTRRTQTHPQKTHYTSIVKKMRLDVLCSAD
jgi:hypothetical protein